MTRPHRALLMLALGLLAACTPATPSIEDSKSALRPTHAATATAPQPSQDPSPAKPTPIPIPADVRQQMSSIEGQVEALRGLRRTGPFERRLLPPQALQRVISERMSSAYSADRAADDSLALEAIGLLPSGFDLESYYADLYGEQAAGFYDPEADVMYVLWEGDFAPQQRLTFAREYVHVLQDQTWPSANELDLEDLDCTRQQDACRAWRAFVEGDASLVEEQWLRTYASDDEVDQLLSSYGALDSSVLNEAPDPLKARLLFPFEAGLEFVRWLERNGGWAAVDAAYQEPPASTEQILHPYLYPDDQPVHLEPLGPTEEALGAGWRQVGGGTLGEFGLYQVLAEHLDDDQAADAAEGWGGDGYQVFYRGEDGATAWVGIQVWDTIRDSQDAMLAWRDAGDARFGEHDREAGAYRWESSDGSAYVTRASTQTLWVEAPDSAAIETLLGSLELPAAIR